MYSIEDICSSFEALSAATGNAWNVGTLVPARLHISRSAEGHYSVFIEGPRESFGKLPPFQGLRFADEVMSVDESRTFPALCISSPDHEHGDRVLAHIAYELARRLSTEPDISNEELFRQVEWVLLLLGAGDGVLSPERQRGLVGECLLLRKLLLLSHRAGLAPSVVLARWWGHMPAKRDFAAQGIAIEVKTTSLSSRQHSVGSLEQLEPQEEGEQVYVYSVGLRTDPSAPKKLCDFVGDVEAQLVTASGEPDQDCIALFREQLKRYGYDPSKEEVYRGAAGYMKPHLPGALFAEESLDRVRATSFKGDTLPSMVRAVSYTLELSGEPLTEEQGETILNSLLTASTMTHQ